MAEPATPQWAWMNGAFIPFAECRLHVRTQAVALAASVFEGVRAYWNPEQEQLYTFELDRHVARLRESMKIMRMTKQVPADFAETCLELLRRNGFREDVHYMPTAYLGIPEGNVAMGPTSDEGLFITAVARPPGKALDAGKSVCVSSWRRISDASVPPRVKAAGNYQNSRLALHAAWADGYDDAVLLNANGTVAEAAGSCLMMVRDGQVCTPPVTAGILESITRAALIRLFADKLGLTVQEREIDRTELYLAEEVFLCGSGMEVVPVTAVDRIPVGQGRKGQITAAIQDAYFRVARGHDNAYPEWRTPVYRKTG
jgi:branched-chain amino acid aminotransferase